MLRLGLCGFIVIKISFYNATFYKRRSRPVFHDIRAYMKQTLKFMRWLIGEPVEEYLIKEEIWANFAMPPVLQAAD